jgi:NTP pyrophosphatase (non-canonical NTP hydrolase)
MDHISPFELEPPRPGLAVVLCGTFHRELEALEAVWREFEEAEVEILSPRDLRFVEDRTGFLLSSSEIDELPAEVEHRHLTAMMSADFIWLHAPDGYVGRSAAMELGFARALGLGVFGQTPPSDVALGELVRQVDSPSSAVEACTPQELASNAPIGGLLALQRYYGRAAGRRGWAGETVNQTLELLAGELGELQEALRLSGGTRDAQGDEDPTLELADVALYVVHLANVLQIDLGRAVAAKEQINATRFPVLVDATA